jgi:hypothetical protein
MPNTASLLKLLPTLKVDDALSLDCIKHYITLLINQNSKSRLFLLALRENGIKGRQ